MTFLFKNPFDGDLQPIQQTPDDIFSHKLLGDGFVVNPKNKTIVAPIEGVIETLHPSKHLLIIKGKDVHVMLHLGFKARHDIVKWHLNIGDHVTVGMPIGTLLENFFKQTSKDQSCNIVFVEKETCTLINDQITCEER
jgi:phosphotransferase system IIA component